MMYFFLLFHLVFVSNLFIYCGGFSDFSSTHSLQQLLQKEEYVIKEMKKYVKIIKKEGANVTPLKTYIKNYKELFTTKKLVEQIAHHPVDAFHLLRLLVIQYEQIARVLSSSSSKGKELINKLDKHRTSEGYPEEEDVMKMAASISRMKKIHNLPMDSFTRGIITAETGKVFQSSSPLDAWDCLTIGMAAVKYYEVGEGYSWLEAARILNDKNGTTAFGFMINEALKHAKEMESIRPSTESTSDKSTEILCRGDDTKEGGAHVNLSCRYVFNGSPYLRIGPMKMEEKSQDPAVMVFHDFLYDSEIIRFIELSAEKMRPSQVVTLEGGRTEINFDRLSQQAWVNDTFDLKFTRRISNRIEAVTGLSTAHGTQGTYTSMPYQVLNYGTGGLYNPHVDYIQTIENGTEIGWVKYGGDRMSTLLMYLSDVEVGGATVFPLIGVSVSPKRGSAAFWYNLYRNGGPDIKSAHSGCPVVHGTKWVCNKWILLYGQTLRESCGLKETDKFTLL